MNDKIRMELILYGRKTDRKEKLVLSGRRIGFDRIMDRLLEFRNLYISFYGESLYVRKINNYEEQYTLESPLTVYSDTAFANKRKEFFISQSIPKIVRIIFYNVLNNIAGKIECGRELAEEVSKEMQARYPCSEWYSSFPLEGALDTLFNKYGDYLR